MCKQAANAACFLYATMRCSTEFVESAMLYAGGTNMRHIGNNIRIIRIHQGITQEELADRLYLTRQAISSYETGRTRPDIDMLVKIADALHTNTDAILYGPPQTTERKRAKIELIIGMITALALSIVYIGLNHYLRHQIGHRIILSIPQNLLRVTLLPALWFVIGWVLIHGFMMLPGMTKIQFKHQQKIYYSIWGLLMILIMLQLPYVIFFAMATYRSFTQTYVAMAFPNIPIYTKTASWLLILTLRASASCSIWGAFIRFLRPNKQ